MKQRDAILTSLKTLATSDPIRELLRSYYSSVNNPPRKVASEKIESTKLDEG